MNPGTWEQYTNFRQKKEGNFGEISKTKEPFILRISATISLAEGGAGASSELDVHRVRQKAGQRCARETWCVCEQVLALFGGQLGGRAPWPGRQWWRVDDGAGGRASHW